jgi:hypothetical protein
VEIRLGQAMIGAGDNGETASVCLLASRGDAPERLGLPARHLRRVACLAGKWRERPAFDSAR